MAGNKKWVKIAYFDFERKFVLCFFCFRTQMPFTAIVLSSYFKMAGLSTKDVMKKYYSLDVPEDEVCSSSYEILFSVLLS